MKKTCNNCGDEMKIKDRFDSFIERIPATVTVFRCPSCGEWQDIWKMK